MRLLCRFIASIWSLYTASTKSVLFWKLAHLLCRYFASNSNQYCACSKPVECQLSMISLLQSLTSTTKEYRASNIPMFGTVLPGSTGITPRLQLAQYRAGCKYCLASDFSTWDIIRYFSEFCQNLPPYYFWYKFYFLSRNIWNSVFFYPKSKLTIIFCCNLFSNDFSGSEILIRNEKFQNPKI